MEKSIEYQFFKAKTVSMILKISLKVITVCTKMKNPFGYSIKGSFGVDLIKFLNQIATSTKSTFLPNED